MGFSLTELLVAISIGSIVIVGAAQMLIGHIKSSANTEAMMRAQDTWARIQHLIDQDIQEAECLSTSTDNKTLTIELPPCDNSTNKKIIYTLDNEELTRTGPSIQSDGTLNTSISPASETVATHVSLFTVSVDQTRAPGSSAIATYKFNTVDPTGFTFSSQKSTEAKSRSRVIDS